MYGIKLYIDCLIIELCARVRAFVCECVCVCARVCVCVCVQLGRYINIDMAVCCLVADVTLCHALKSECVSQDSFLLVVNVDTI